jgi:hypothetical protein
MHFNVTQYPTQAWLSRQLTEAFPWDMAPRYLPRDRDKSYGPSFRNRVQAMGIEEIVTAPRSPSSPVMILKISRQDAAEVTLGGRSASSLRTSRRVTSEVRQPTRPLRRKGSLHFSTVVTRNGAQEFSLILHRSRPPRSRSTDRPVNKFQPRSSVAQLQPKFLSKNSQRRSPSGRAHVTSMTW